MSIDISDLMIAHAAAEVAGKTQLMTQIEEKLCDSPDTGQLGLSASAPVVMGPLSMEMSIDGISLTWSDFSESHDDGFRSPSPMFKDFEQEVSAMKFMDKSPITSPMTSPSRRSTHKTGSPLLWKQTGSLTSLERHRLASSGSYNKLNRSPSGDIFPMEITETLDDYTVPENKTHDDLLLVAKAKASQTKRIRSYSSSAHWPEVMSSDEEKSYNMDDSDVTALPKDDAAKSPLSKHLSLPSDIEKSLENIDLDLGSGVLSSFPPSDGETKRKTAKTISQEQNIIKVTAIIHDEGVGVDTPSPMDEHNFDDNPLNGAEENKESHRIIDGARSESTAAVEQKTSSLEVAFGTHVTDSGYASSLPTGHLVTFSPDTDSEAIVDETNQAGDGGDHISIVEQLKADLEDFEESRPVRKSRSYEKAISSGEGLDYEFSEDESSKRASMLEDVEEVPDENEEMSESDVTETGEQSIARLGIGKVFMKEIGQVTPDSEREILIDYPPAGQVVGGRTTSQEEVNVPLVDRTSFTISESEQCSDVRSPIIASHARVEYQEHKTDQVHVVERLISGESGTSKGEIMKATSGLDLPVSSFLDLHSPEAEMPSPSERKDSFEASFEETLDSLSPCDQRFSAEIPDFLPSDHAVLKIDMCIGETDVDTDVCDQNNREDLRNSATNKNNVHHKEREGIGYHVSRTSSSETPASISPERGSIHLVDEMCEIYEQTKRLSGLFDTKPEQEVEPTWIEKETTVAPSVINLIEESEASDTACTDPLVGSHLDEVVRVDKVDLENSTSSDTRASPVLPDENIELDVAESSSLQAEVLDLAENSQKSRTREDDAQDKEILSVESENIKEPLQEVAMEEPTVVAHPTIPDVSSTPGQTTQGSAEKPIEKEAELVQSKSEIGGINFEVESQAQARHSLATLDDIPKTKDQIMSTSLPPMHIQFESSAEQKKKEVESHVVPSPTRDTEDVEVVDEPVVMRKPRFTPEPETKLPVRVSKTPPAVPKRTSRDTNSVVGQVDWLSKDRPKVTDASAKETSIFGAAAPLRSKSVEKETTSHQRESPAMRSKIPLDVHQPPEPFPVKRDSIEAQTPSPDLEDSESDAWKPRESMRLSSDRFTNVRPLFSALEPDEHESLLPIITSSPTSEEIARPFPTTEKAIPVKENVFHDKRQMVSERGDSSDRLSDSSARRASSSAPPEPAELHRREKSMSPSEKRVHIVHENATSSSKQLIEPGWSAKRVSGKPATGKSDGVQKTLQAPLTVDTSAASELNLSNDEFTPREKMKLSPSRFPSMSNSLTEVSLEKLRYPKALSEVDSADEEDRRAPLSPRSRMSASYPSDPVERSYAGIRRSQSSACENQSPKQEVDQTLWKGRKPLSYGLKNDKTTGESVEKYHHGDESGMKKDNRVDSSGPEEHLTEKSAEASLASQPGDTAERKGSGVKRKKSVRELLSKFETGKSEECQIEAGEVNEESAEKDKYRPAVFQKPKIIRLRSLSPSHDSLALRESRSPEDGDKQISRLSGGGRDQESAMDTSPKFQRFSSGSLERQSSPRLSPRSDVSDGERVSPRLKPKPSPSDVDAMHMRKCVSEGSEGEREGDESPNSMRRRLRQFGSASSDASRKSPDFSRFRRKKEFDNSTDSKDSDTTKSKIAKPVSKVASRSQSMKIENEQGEDLTRFARFRRKSDMSQRDSSGVLHDRKSGDSNDGVEFKSRLPQLLGRGDSVSRGTKTLTHDSVSSSGSKGSCQSLGEVFEPETDTASVKETLTYDSKRTKSVSNSQEFGSESKRDDSNSWPRRGSGEGVYSPRKWTPRTESSQMVALDSQRGQHKSNDKTAKSREEPAAGSMFGVKLRKTKRFDSDGGS